MTYRMKRQVGLGAAAILATLAGCSHDSQRENLLDPQLTPPVTLTAVAEDSTGTIRLSWTPTVGEFAEYLVLRNLSRQTQVDTLARIVDRAVTSWVDTVDAGAEFEYRVSVKNVGGLEAASVATSPSPVNLPGVSIRSLEFDASSATAALQWSTYEGPRFGAYHVRRSSPGELPAIVHSATDARATAFVDSGLHGNTNYSYEVLVVTERHEEVASAARGGSFHDLVATWDLGLAGDEFVRLADDEDGHITALITNPERVETVAFEPDGTFVERSTLVDISPLRFVPRAVTVVHDAEGERYLGYAIEPVAGLVAVPQVGVAALDSRRTQPLFTNVELPIDDSVQVDAAIGLAAQEVAGGGPDVPSEAAVSLVDRLRITGDAVLVTDTGFDAELSVDWVLSNATQSGDKLLLGGLREEGTASRQWQAGPWRRIQLSARLNRLSGTLLLTVGDLSATDRAKLSVRLRPALGDATMQWQVRGRNDFTRRETSDLTWARNWPYDLDIDLAVGSLNVSMTSGLLWTTRESLEPATWVSVVSVRDAIGLAIDNEGRSVTHDGEERQSIPLSGPISDIRTWESGPRREMIGVCMPASDQVLIDAAGLTGTRRIDWPALETATALGVGLGQGDGEFHVPLSFDVAPDGRIYVLDAGNSRIQVFDADGKYVTQWGQRGSAGNQFDFGQGRSSEDFAGSIAVDDEGFIYVADMGNGVIKKFAP